MDLFHIPNITIDQVMLRAFPMSLTGAVSLWLRNKPPGLITTWEDLKTKFLSKYCPPARTTKKMEEINNFQQEPGENLYQAWERFKELLMKCPQCHLTKMQEDVNNAKDPITPKIAHSKRKEKILKKLITRNLVDLFQGGGYRATAPVSEEQRKSFIPRVKAIYGRYPEQIHE
ncbi:reverse transcriptase domain-containing protein [Tanacetum coccineum]